MKFWVLIGLGSNDVKVPCLIFSTKKKAMDYCIELLGEPKDMGSPKWDVYDLTTGYDEEDESKPQLSDSFFTSYYDGCGACYGFALKEIEEGQPFVPFNLD